MGCGARTASHPKASVVRIAEKPTCSPYAAGWIRRAQPKKRREKDRGVGTGPHCGRDRPPVAADGAGWACRQRGNHSLRAPRSASKNPQRSKNIWRLLLCRVADAGDSDAGACANSRRRQLAKGRNRGRGTVRVRLALWGFELGRRDDGGGFAAWSRSPENAKDADAGSRAAETRPEDGDLTGAATVGDCHRAHSAKAGR